MVTANSTEPAPSLRAATVVARLYGISDVTLWRWKNRGWIQMVNIGGRLYVTSESIAAFDRRATSGEFAKAPRGAARKSQEIAKGGITK
jgi:hypothetical protein